MSNANNIILNNLQSMGVISEESYEFISLFNDYKIYFDRKPRQTMFNSNEEYSYICTITIKNNLGITLYTINTNENRIMYFLDCLYNYIEFNMVDVITPLMCYNNDSVVTFGFRRNDRDEYYNEELNNDQSFYIYEKNILSGKLNERFRIQFNDEKLSEFANCIYMKFVSDLGNPKTLFLSPDFLL